MNWSLILIAFWSGILSTLTPCNIIALPTYATQVFKESNNWKRGFYLSIYYGLGFCMVFTLIGTALLFIPGFIKNQVWLQVIGGSIIILFGILTLTSILSRKHPKKDEKKQNDDPNEFKLEDNKIEEFHNENAAWKFILIGMSFGTSGFSCVLPLFVPVISMIVLEGSAYIGIPYLFIYSFGIFFPYIPIGIGLGKLNEFVLLKIMKYQTHLNRILGLIMIIMGILYLKKGINMLGIA